MKLIRYDAINHVMQYKEMVRDKVKKQLEKKKKA